ncbi:hypothetical protein ACVXG7_17825 [Enterobacter hormaechei]
MVRGTMGSKKIRMIHARRKNMASRSPLKMCRRSSGIASPDRRRSGRAGEAGGAD